MISMTRENYERERPITVGFRVSRELNEEIDRLVAISGMTKQDYIVSRVLEKDIQVKPSPYLYKVLVGEMREVCKQLERIRRGDNPSERLLDTCDLLGNIMASISGDPVESSIETEDDIVINMRRC